MALAPGAVGGLDLPVLGPTRKHPSTIKALRAACRAAGVVVAHGSTTLPLCALVRPMTGTPFVYRQISESTFWADSTARRLRVRAALTAARRVVALWSGSADTLHDDVRRRPSQDPRRFRTASRRIAFHRSIEHTPLRPAQSFGLDPAIADDPVDRCSGAGEGCRSGHRRREPDSTHAQLLIVGDGPSRAELEAEPLDAAPGRVVFTGSVREPRPCFEAADAVVLPSRGGDSMPAVLIEAGLMGVPAVATPVEGIVEILDHGRAGELVHGEDADALRAGITKMVSDETYAHTVATAARRHCLDHYAIDVVAEQWDDVLTELAP